MIKLGTNRDDGAVGIDIGGHSIKVVVMSGSSEEPLIEAYNTLKISSSEDKPDLTRHVKSAVEEIDIRPKSVNISVAGSDVIVRFINLPKMTKEQLDAALVFEAEKYIPFNVREVVLDSVLLGDAPEQGQMRVLLTAAKREAIEGRLRVFTDIGMEVNFIDVNAFSCFNAFLASGAATGKSVVALIEIGHIMTSLLISIDGVPFFMRQIQIGGRDVDVMIARSLSVTTEKAGEYKQGVGDFDRDTVDSCVKKVLQDIVREIQLSFGYFEGTCNRSIEGIYCSGGMVYVDGVLAYLSEKMGIAAEKWDPLFGIKTSDVISRDDLDSVSSKFAVSIGLARRG
jgi:type IV pilus assembly protein PilM